MKIAIVAPSPVPYVIGGAEKLWWGMLNYLNHHTEHQAELIKIPSPERTFQELVQSYQDFNQLDLSHFDCVISTKYPAWMIDHHNHICYMQHKLRGLYDTYHLTGLSEKLCLTDYPEAYASLLTLLTKKPSRSALPEVFNQLKTLFLREDSEAFFTFPGALSRAVIHFLDAIAFSNDAIQSFSSISQTVKNRTDYFPSDAIVNVAHHPSDLHAYKTGIGKHVFTISRLDGTKRIDLLIRAFKKTSTDISLLIAGTGPDEERLKALAKGDKRIRFLGRITDREVIDYYSESLFVPFFPYDEDYGLVTIEAMSSGKAVLTTNDSGGVLEFVEHRVNGWVALPTVESLQTGLSQLLDDVVATELMGKRALKTTESISWEHVFNTLFQKGSVGPKSRPLNCVVVSSFEVSPPRTGGQSRIYNLYRKLAKQHNVTIVSLGNLTETKQIDSTFREVVVGFSQEQREYIAKFKEGVAVEVGDIAAIDGIPMNNQFLEVLRKQVRNADVVIASHPYAYKAIKVVWQGFLVYDSHNVEFDMKKLILEQEQKAEQLLSLVEQVESDCINNAQIVSCCSEKDRERFIELYEACDAAFITLPNGIDAQSNLYVPQKLRHSNRKRLGLNESVKPILYMGSWHQPNIEAAKFVIKIAESKPEMTFWFMGSMCDHPDLRHLPENILPLGVLSPEEKAIVMGAVAVGLNPIEHGSGTNLKLLDYIDSGVPAVTTRFGNRGLDFLHNQEIIECELADFPDAIHSLLSMPDKPVDDMTSRAREKAADLFDWSVLAKALSSTLMKKIH